jgi:hypothetical protein
MQTSVLIAMVASMAASRSAASFFWNRRGKKPLHADYILIENERRGKKAPTQQIEYQTNLFHDLVYLLPVVATGFV